MYEPWKHHVHFFVARYATHQNSDEGLQPLKGQCHIAISVKRQKTAGNLWNAPFRGVVPKTSNTYLITVD